MKPRGKQKQMMEALAEDNKNWKNKIHKRKEDSHTSSWDDIDFQTGNIIIPKEQKEEIWSSEEENSSFDEQVDNDLEEIDCIKKLEEVGCRINELKTAFEHVKIPLILQYQAKGFRIHSSKKPRGVKIWGGPGVVFDVNETSKKPKGIMLSIRFDSETERVIKDGKIQIDDGCFRKIVIFETRSRFFFCHCGRRDYSLSYMLKILNNPSILLNVSPSRISGFFSFNIDVTINTEETTKSSLVDSSPMGSVFKNFNYSNYWKTSRCIVSIECVE